MTDLTLECQVSEKLSGCDHHLIHLTIRTDHELTENRFKIPNYRRANFKGSVLGPILFTLYINDLELGLKPSLSKFVNDTKVEWKALTTADCEIIQKDLNQFTQWSEKWQMSFTTTKCKVMHIDSRNSNHTHHMGGKQLQVTQEERDLGITISSDLNKTKHFKTACIKTNTMLGFIVRNFEYKTPGVMTTLYNSLVRLHLEYAVQL